MAKNNLINRSSGLITVNLTIVVLLSLFASAQPASDEIITAKDKLAPPCTGGGGLYLRYKEDSKCYKANEQGPCPENMVLYAHPSAKIFGFCDCFDARAETKEEAAFLISRNLSHCIKEIRGQLYVPERNRCYSVFHQGPCSEGKWLVLNGTYYPVCAKNTCLNFTTGLEQQDEQLDPLSTKYVFATSSTSECFSTMSQGNCGKSFELRFSSNHFIPRCRYIPANKAVCPEIKNKSPVRKLLCKPGSRYDILTKCATISLNPR